MLMLMHIFNKKQKDLLIRILIGLIAGIFVHSGYCVPWSDAETIEIDAINSGSSAWSRGYPLLMQHYEERFGAFVDIMIWGDVDIHKALSWYVKMEQKSTEFAPWKEIKPYLFFQLKSAKTNECKYVPLSDSLLNWMDGPRLSYDNKVEYTINVQIEKLSVPMDSSAWELTLQVWDGLPPNEKELCSSERSPNIAKSLRSTPIDTLMWAQEMGLIDNNPSLCRSMLRYFKYDRIFLQKMLNYSVSLGDCDSVKVYGERLLDSWKNRLDPYYLDRGPYFDTGIDPNPGPTLLTQKRFDRIISTMLDACGDTTGLTQYAP